jgi:ferritin
MNKTKKNRIKKYKTKKYKIKKNKTKKNLKNKSGGNLFSKRHLRTWMGKATKEDIIKNLHYEDIKTLKKYIEKIINKINFFTRSIYNMITETKSLDDWDEWDDIKTNLTKYIKQQEKEVQKLKEILKKINVTNYCYCIINLTSSNNKSTEAYIEASEYISKVVLYSKDTDPLVGFNQINSEGKDFLKLLKDIPKLYNSCDIIQNENTVNDNDDDDDDPYATETNKSNYKPYNIEPEINNDDYENYDSIVEI